MLFAITAAFAGPDEEHSETYINPDDFKLEASAGAMLYLVPKYEGSNVYQYLYMPEADLQYGPLFASVSQGAGVYLPVNESRTFIFAPAIRWRVKRNLGDPRDPIEYIMDIRPTVTLNTILKFDPWIFNFRMTDGLIGDNKGSSYNLGITWKDDISEKVNLTIYATAIYGSKTFNQTYFGITKTESARFGYEVYNPSSGLKSLDIGWILKYLITEKTSIDFAFEYLRLVGPAAKSTITRDKNQLLFGIGATYRF
jgi:outer membrane scaffolding protein for murein synthesis (MipA/OmpV family)